MVTVLKFPCQFPHASLVNFDEESPVGDSIKNNQVLTVDFVVRG